MILAEIIHKRTQWGPVRALVAGAALRVDGTRARGIELRVRWDSISPVRAPDLDLPGVSAGGWTRHADSISWIADPRAHDEIEDDLIRIAYATGAPDIARTIHGPGSVMGLLGDSPYRVAGAELSRGEGADSDEIALAQARGLISWMWCPLVGSRAGTSGRIFWSRWCDQSGVPAAGDGSRHGPAPRYAHTPMRAQVRGAAHRIVWDLRASGRATAVAS